ncbi:MAG: hypothetical protein U9P36_03200 [Thermodesulfobacteriota bacterium]|nr:hypothetical protein [Thermodesulfobacteriota bacterium]
MTPFIRFYRDQSQLPRVQADPAHTCLADYLESDLQDTGTAAEVLALLKKSAVDKQEISGNSYTVILDADQITLESLFDDDPTPCQLSLVEFQLLLTGWIQFLDNDSLLSLVPDF